MHVIESGYTLEQALESVGTGWHKLIIPLFEAKPADVAVVQVKEKFGMLCFYWELLNQPYKHGQYTEFSELVSKAEADSCSICEDCGTIGKRCNIGYWIRTLCESCKDKCNARKETSR
jgi:hypothetical protein